MLIGMCAGARLVAGAGASALAPRPPRRMNLRSDAYLYVLYLPSVPPFLDRVLDSVPVRALLPSTTE